jgi:hypothetical protein
MTTELVKDRVDAAAANRVRWGTRSTLVAALLHLLELETDLELLRSGCNMDLTEDHVDALWTRMRPTSDSLARTSFLRSPATFLMAWGSGSLRHGSFALNRLLLSLCDVPPLSKDGQS